MKTFVKRSVGRQEVIRFLRSYVGGTVYFWSGYAVFAALYSGFGWDWLYAKIVCDIVGFSLNYLVQRFWAFSDMATGHKEQAMAGKFSFISVVGIGLDYAIITGRQNRGHRHQYQGCSVLQAMSLWRLGDREKFLESSLPV